MLKDLTGWRAFRVMFGGAAGLGIAYTLARPALESIVGPILEPVGEHIEEYTSWRKQRARAARDPESTTRGHRT